MRASGFINKTVVAVLGCLLTAGVCAADGSAPQVEIGNRSIHARVYLPDAKSGFYRGTRFDWSGVIEGLEYAGHNYYPRWFQRVDPNVQDFVYDGADIVASSCTAITGPAEEFGVVGFDEARAGGSFIKIGVGVLRKPDDAKYSPYRLYPIADGGKWTVSPKPDAVEFRQELVDAASGYGYVYQKTVSVAGEKPMMVLRHSLRNTGKRLIDTSVYNHNFLYLDQQSPGPDFRLTFPFTVLNPKPQASGLAEIRENQISFSKVLTGEERVYLDIRGFGAEAKDYDIRIENRGRGAGLRITSDRPMSRLALWAIRAPLSIEPFIAMSVEPGKEFTWQINYEYYRVPEGAK
jgi:hypothetical protein